MLKELAPITPQADDIWTEAVTNLLDNPNSIQPVILRNPSDNSVICTFRASLLRENGKTFFQIEDLDPVEFAEGFLEASNGEWEIHIGGIYRLPIN